MRGRRAGQEGSLEQLREIEVIEMVERHRHLIAFGRNLARGEDGAGVIDQHVQPVILRQELLRHLTHLGHQRQVAGNKAHLVIAGGCLDLGGCRLALLRAAADEDDLGPLRRQCLGGNQPDTASRAGNEAGLTRHAWSGRSGAKGGLGGIVGLRRELRLCCCHVFIPG